MSWDADLSVDGVSWAGLNWNYTHNTSCMIRTALEVAGQPLGYREGQTALRPAPDGGWIKGPASETWWDRLNGMTGAEGCQYLTTILEHLEADPDRYRAMNPANGWGDYDSLVKVLGDMRDACTSEVPMHWCASG